MSSPYSSRKDRAGTTNRSIAATPSVIAREHLPSRRRRPSPPCHILGDTGLPNANAELEKFAMNASCAPQRGDNAHLPDQLPDLSRHPRAAPTRSRLPAPVTPEACMMPRTTVSGRMMASSPRVFGNSWQGQPRTNLSAGKKGTRSGLRRRRTKICCRKTMISASRAAHGRKRSMTAPKIALQRSDISQRIIRFCVLMPTGWNLRKGQSILASPFKSKCQLEAENVALRLPSIEWLKVSAPSHPDLFSTVFIINIAESRFLAHTGLHHQCVRIYFAVGTGFICASIANSLQTIKIRSRFAER
jgi:hypothetical protein